MFFQMSTITTTTKTTTKPTTTTIETDPEGNEIYQSIPNINAHYKNNAIIFGLGWAAAPPKPDTQLYSIEATNDPKVFQIRYAPQQIPSSNSVTHKGKYYHCIFNIAEKRVMIIGGRPGTAKDYWDDKSFVYQWEGTDFTQGGRYVGTDQKKMESSPESCRGVDESAGCVRKNEWPDLPSTSLLQCQGNTKVCLVNQSGHGGRNVPPIFKIALKTLHVNS